ncbi:MOSC N-terminal beta barrel domain-containing protein [Catalinimonas sp. 4WD22]|uniref:MOSC domain-containing protein n=1 Tax=Catalinimonas locisalis TaxID=3133978 RepID=UPI003100D2E1
MPYIEKLTLYPIKSLDGIEVTQASITDKGALYLDRMFALYNQAGRTVNAKKYPAIQKVRAGFDLHQLRVNLSTPEGLMASFQMEHEQQQIAEFFSEYLKEPVFIKQNEVSGFPDDDENSGPTIVSTATYLEVQQWFPDLSLGNIRRRFRANIELGDCYAPFWEDRLFDVPGTDKFFQLGNVSFVGKKPCARCTVPTRDPLSSIADNSFMSTFINRREESLPSFAQAEQFNHYYHLCVNTVIPDTEKGKILQLKDQLNVL